MPDPTPPILNYAGGLPPVPVGTRFVRHDLPGGGVRFEAPAVGWAAVRWQAWALAAAAGVAAVVLAGLWGTGRMFGDTAAVFAALVVVLGGALALAVWYEATQTTLVELHDGELRVRAPREGRATRSFGTRHVRGLTVSRARNGSGRLRIEFVLGISHTNLRSDSADELEWIAAYVNLALSAAPGGSST